jgi:scyllo-inositol 2-dehydrogenase (NAD+)
MGRRHAENLRHLVPGAQLVAVADAVEDRARKVAAELEIEKSFGSLEAMLECNGVDAVVIATPDAFHAPAVSLTAAAGKPMLCEKPLALNLADARNALAAVAKHKVYFQVGFMRRYDPAYSLAMKRIEAGEIGSPLIFKSLGRDKEGPPLSYYHSQVNGMLFYTNTIHDFDLARWMVQDEVTEVHAFTTSAVRPEVTQFGDVVASVVNLKFAKGAIGNIESHAQAQYGYDVRTEVVGSKGSLQVGSLHRTPATFLTTSGSVSPIVDYFLSTFADAYLAEMRDFVDRILNDRPPSVTGEDGFKALAMAAAAEQSHAQSRVTRVEA